MNEMPTLHYVYDPFCGWCFGAAPLLSAAAHVPGLRIALHGGGLLTGDRARSMDDDWREFVRPHEQRITTLTGQGFGSRYRDIAQFDRSLRLDSGPPTAAMLAAEAAGGLGLAVLKRLQKAYYLDGRPIADHDELLRQASELGLPDTAFEAALDQAMSGLGRHFAASHALLQSLGARGYPTLALQRGDQLELLPLGQWLGRPAPLRTALEQKLGLTGLAAAA
ncbi:MAG: protein-disulfide isomerase [Roseateles depolymerans]|uniref:Protein-disulfide isomerase n=1 Tax=Roseateles depolymerans TaxID=76731 RepID=A0A2W5DR41_9BURK|nr:MAG: protein-disulfide isomerase [Roseateles depolymerans]